MVNSELLSEKEISKERLAALFKQAFFSTSFDKDGDLVVRSDGPRVFVIVDSQKKLLKYMAIYGVKETAPLELKHQFVNRMNDDIIFVRFSIPGKRHDVLMADYYLPYEDGIPAFQIIAAFRLFSRVVPGAIRACDELDLVE